MDFVLGGGTGWIPPRGYLMPSAHRRPRKEHYSFAPELNPRSSELALQRRPVLRNRSARGDNSLPTSTEEDIAAYFESLYREREEWAYKTAQMRERLAKAEMTECTFTPRLSVDPRTTKRLSKRRQQRQSYRAQMDPCEQHDQQASEEQEPEKALAQRPPSAEAPNHSVDSMGISAINSTSALEEQFRHSLSFPLPRSH